MKRNRSPIAFSAVIFGLVIALISVANPAQSHSSDSLKIKRLEKELKNLRWCINKNYDRFGIEQTFRGPYDDPNKFEWNPSKC